MLLISWLNNGNEQKNKKDLIAVKIVPIVMFTSKNKI